VILLTADEYEFIGQQLRLISFVEGSDEEKRNRIKYAFKSIISLSGQKFMNYNEVTIRSALELITGIKSSNNLLDSITINDILDRQKLSDSDLAQLIEHIENKMILFKAARNNPSYMIKKNDDIIYWIPEDFFP
jgi:ribosomal protein S13